MLLTLGTSIFVCVVVLSEVLLHSHTPIQYGKLLLHAYSCHFHVRFSDFPFLLALCCYLFASTFCYTYDMKRALFRFLLQRILFHPHIQPHIHSSSPMPACSYLAFWLAHSTISLVNRPLSFLWLRCSSLSRLFMVESSPALILRKVSRHFILARDCCG
jgi:hypothetical protein